jgi:hypothetical protein
MPAEVTSTDNPDSHPQLSHSKRSSRHPVHINCSHSGSRTHPIQHPPFQNLSESSPALGTTIPPPQPSLSHNGPSWPPTSLTDIIVGLISKPDGDSTLYAWSIPFQGTLLLSGSGKLPESPSTIVPTTRTRYPSRTLLCT